MNDDIRQEAMRPFRLGDQTSSVWSPHGRRSRQRVCRLPKVPRSRSYCDKRERTPIEDEPLGTAYETLIDDEPYLAYRMAWADFAWPDTSVGQDKLHSCPESAGHFTG